MFELCVRSEQVLFNKNPRPASVRAVGNLKLMAIEADHFPRLLEQLDVLATPNIPVMNLY